MELNIWEDVRDRLSLSALGKPAIIGLAALIAMVAVFAGKHIVDTATASDFKVERAETQAESAEEAPRPIFVHVSGAVNEPGLVELDSGSRVADAVKGAGGFAEDAVADSVNLARLLEDGEQLHVKSKAEAEAAAGAAGGGAQAGQGGVTGAGGLVNVNTATESELETLPGIGPSTAAKIVAYRQSNGPFGSVEDLKRVSGVGEKKLDAIADLVCV